MILMLTQTRIVIVPLTVWDQEQGLELTAMVITLLLASKLTCSSNSRTHPS